MEKKRLSRILEKTEGAILKELAEPLIEKYPVQVCLLYTSPSPRDCS